jgi:hypothetical protein
VPKWNRLSNAIPTDKNRALSNKLTPETRASANRFSGAAKTAEHGDTVYGWNEKRAALTD